MAFSATEGVSVGTAILIFQCKERRQICRAVSRVLRVDVGFLGIRSSVRFPSPKLKTKAKVAAKIPYGLQPLQVSFSKNSFIISGQSPPTSLHIPS